MGLAVPKRPHALLAGVCKLHEDMSGTLASAACALERALVHPEAVHAVFSSIDATLSRIDGLMHAFFQNAKAGQLAQAVVLERAVEELACARVAGWLQQGSAELPSIMEAKHELEHAAESVHHLLASYHELCFRLHGLTDAFWRVCYDQVPRPAREHEPFRVRTSPWRATMSCAFGFTSSPMRFGVPATASSPAPPASTSPSGAVALMYARALGRCLAPRARRWPRATCQSARHARPRAHCGRACSSATTRPSGAWRRHAERRRHTALTQCS